MAHVRIRRDEPLQREGPGDLRLRGRVVTPYLVGVSLKMYFSHAQTLEWCRAVADLARRHPAMRDGNAELFVIPTYLSVPAALDILGDVAAVGAQDLAMADTGAFTGEVS